MRVTCSLQLPFLNCCTVWKSVGSGFLSVPRQQVKPTSVQKAILKELAFSGGGGASRGVFEWMFIILVIIWVKSKERDGRTEFLDF